MACSLGRTVPLLVVVLDKKILNWMLNLGYNAVLASDNVQQTKESESAEIFGSSEFNMVSQRKISAVLDVNKAGIDGIYVDSNIYWCDKD